MKVLTDTKPVFRPVTIVLETKEELDQLYAILNHDWIIPDDSPLGDAWEKLQGIAETNHANHEALTDRLKVRVLK